MASITERHLLAQQQCFIPTSNDNFFKPGKLSANSHIHCMHWLSFSSYQLKNIRGHFWRTQFSKLYNKHSKIQQKYDQYLWTCISDWNGDPDFGSIMDISWPKKCWKTGKYLQVILYATLFLACILTHYLLHLTSKPFSNCCRKLTM